MDDFRLTNKREFRTTIFGIIPLLLSLSLGDSLFSRNTGRKPRRFVTTQSFFDPRLLLQAALDFITKSLPLSHILRVARGSLWPCPEFPRTNSSDSLPLPPSSSQPPSKHFSTPCFTPHAHVLRILLPSTASTSPILFLHLLFPLIL